MLHRHELQQPRTMQNSLASVALLLLKKTHLLLEFFFSLNAILKKKIKLKDICLLTQECRKNIYLSKWRQSEINFCI